MPKGNVTAKWNICSYVYYRLACHFYFWWIYSKNYSNSIFDACLSILPTSVRTKQPCQPYSSTVESSLFWPFFCKKHIYFLNYLFVVIKLHRKAGAEMNISNEDSHVNKFKRFDTFFSQIFTSRFFVFVCVSHSFHFTVFTFLWNVKWHEHQIPKLHYSQS